MKKVTLVLLILVLVTLSGLAACAQPTPTPKPTPAPTPTQTPTIQGKIALRNGTALAGSTTYVIGAAMSRIVGQYVPNTSMEVVAINGNEAKLRMCSTKEMDFGNAELIELYEAVNGAGRYADGKVPARVVFAGQESVWQWFTINPKIQILADLKGSAVNYRITDTSSVKMKIYDATFEWLNSTYGFSVKDIKSIDYTSTEKSCSDLLAGTADVASTFSKASPNLLDLATRSASFRILPYPDTCVNYILQKYPALGKTVIPKKTYGSYPPEDLQTMASSGIVYARTDLSDDTVYQVTKAIFEHLSEFQGIIGVVGADFTLKHALEYAVVPFHAGAIKYYKEKGLWTAELEKKQTEMLAKLGTTK